MAVVLILLCADPRENVILPWCAAVRREFQSCVYQNGGTRYERSGVSYFFDLSPTSPLSSQHTTDDGGGENEHFRYDFLYIITNAHSLKITVLKEKHTHFAI